MHPAQRLRQTLSEGSLIVAPGAYDCLSAKAVESAGFSAIYMTGMGTSACRLGLPDYGLATMSEMVANAAAMTFAVETPIIADADTGYGNELNMTRTVREYERQGVAGIHIEDQAFPKKCGHLERKSVIGHDAYISKIRAAVDARSNSDFIIIARTDANGVLGFDAAIKRANSALDAGADLALVEAPTSIEQLRAVPALVNGPCVLNVLLGGKSPLLSLEQIEEFGYRMVLLSDALLGTAMAAYDAALRSVLTAKGPLHLPGITSPKELFQRLGSMEWDNLNVHTAKEEEISMA
ncbi:MAG: isocitrate lyase/PEP mutase family protein [Acidobacteriaceae bacterium]